MPTLVTLLTTHLSLAICYTKMNFNFYLSLLFQILSLYHTLPTALSFLYTHSLFLFLSLTNTISLSLNTFPMSHLSEIVSFHFHLFSAFFFFFSLSLSLWSCLKLSIVSATLSHSYLFSFFTILVRKDRSFPD